jgi:hypothetical protein
VIDQEWLDAKTFNSVDVGAAARIRLLLRWAEIDPHIPAQLSDLHSATKDRGMLDAADAIVWVRNRIAHPPRRYKGGALEWPQRELADTWRLGLEYVELVLLRVLGHQSKYGSRLHVDGRWPNDTTPVPWQPARSGTRATQEVPEHQS